MIICLTGTNDPGKNEAASVLIGKGFEYRSPLDEARVVAAEEGTVVDERTISDFLDARARVEPLFWVNRILSSLRNDQDVVIDHISTTQEVTFLKQRSAIIIGVYASVEIRLLRTLAKSASHGKADRILQNARMLQMSDYTIINEPSTDFPAQIARILSGVKHGPRQLA
ncbi:MAG: hypothetical protein ABIH41_02870 [Nanoarchaeota archaeon]